MPKSFTIKDKHGRLWGSFEVQREYAGKIHGYLSPSKEFDNVRSVFLDHETALSSESGDTETTSHAIVQLGAFLINNDTGKKIDIKNFVFINSNLLVTCELPTDSTK